MKIKSNTETLQPMSQWLINRKSHGYGDEKELRAILSLPDYKVEFDRYSDPSLPVCGISLGAGRVIHAWDKARIDDYLEIEKLTALTGDHPKYLGWVPLSRVLNQKP